VKRKRALPAPAAIQMQVFADLRIAWIDRLDRALSAHPGAPPGTDLAYSVTKLRAQLRDYREGFIAALNLSKVRK
jgi:hypothetical protein